MISRSTSLHFCLMLGLTIIHAFLSVVAGLVALESYLFIQESFQCAVGHLSEHSIYLCGNLLICLFFFHCARYSKIHSNDIEILETKKSATIYIIPVTGIIFFSHVVINKICQTVKFPGMFTFVYCSHLLIEFLIVYFYFGWYRSELTGMSSIRDIQEDPEK